MAGKTAILVDGGFYRKRARQLWGEKTPAETADGLFTYCKRHFEHIDGLNFRGNPYPQDQRNETAGGTSSER